MSLVYILGMVEEKFENSSVNSYEIYGKYKFTIPPV